MPRGADRRSRGFTRRSLAGCRRSTGLWLIDSLRPLFGNAGDVSDLPPSEERAHLQDLRLPGVSLQRCQDFTDMHVEALAPANQRIKRMGLPRIHFPAGMGDVCIAGIRRTYRLLSARAAILCNTDRML